MAHIAMATTNKLAHGIRSFAERMYQDGNLTWQERINSQSRGTCRPLGPWSRPRPSCRTGSASGRTAEALASRPCSFSR